MLLLKKERNENFIRVCAEIEKKILKQKRENNKIPADKRKKMVSVSEICTAAINHYADGFFISDLKKMYWKVKTNPDLITDTPRGMLYREILHTFLTLRRENPTYCNAKIIEIIELLPAPKFYISVETAKKIYYEHFRKN